MLTKKHILGAVSMYWDLDDLSQCAEIKVERATWSAVSLLSEATEAEPPNILLETA